MFFDGSGGYAPPSARHLFPDSAGRSARLLHFPFRPGQRGIAPLCVRPPYQPRRQVELAERHVLHAVGPPAAPGRPVDTPALDVFVDVLQNSSDVFRHRLLPPSSQSRSAAQR